ncbi:MAG: ATP:cob(I)alamin adenosyltransferase [Microgenomates group bacterium]
MSVVTKTGDDGKSRWQGKIVDKDSELLEAIGEIDELMAVVAVAGENIKGINKITDSVNRELYYLSGYLAGYTIKLDLKKSIELVESDILRMEKEAGPIEEFLKAGKQLNVWLNWVRVVVRRIERRIVRLDKVKRLDKDVMIFINRLSDYFFILARVIK